MRLRPFMSSTVLLPVILLVATACGDSSGPGPATLVTLEAIGTGPSLGVNDDGETTYSCEITLEAVATGTGAATWESGAIYITWGAGPGEEQDTLPMTGQRVGEVLGASAIEPGEMLDARFVFTAPFTFHIRIEVDYLPSARARARSAEASYLCGPQV